MVTDLKLLTDSGTEHKDKPHTQNDAAKGQRHANQAVTVAKSVATDLIVDNASDNKVNEAQRAVKYANLHRALLTGLLSVIAHKTDQRGEYLAARQQKAKIFPASTVFKQVPAWVMAFEIVETSQVFMRTVAKIEPEWIISAGAICLNTITSSRIGRRKLVACVLMLRSAYLV
nr:oligonucleotide/oligosaccharide-binding fold domain-containing protein [Psychrobacter sp. PraFG1]UNK06541.1 hypothetical protein MN210_06720 [Psychrobacter sp. PraFG1]